MTTPAPKPTDTPITVYSFPGKASPFGDSPTSDLVFSSSTHLLYGSTYGGGSTPKPSPDPCTAGCGTIYSIDPAKGYQEKVVWRFGGAPDGAIPVGDLSLIRDVIYGTTTFGGYRNNATCPHGCGTVFKLTTAGNETVLHRFRGGKDGANPAGALFANTGSSSAATLYGTTQYGGKNDLGTVFSVGPKGYKLLYTFGSRSEDGKYPVGNLIGLGGAIYGVTTFGGKYGLGTLFALTLRDSISEKSIYDFSSANGDNPVGLDSWGSQNVLYVATSADGPFAKGSILAISPTGKIKWIYGFKGNPDGAIPLSQPRIYVAAKMLYGSTHGGGEFGVGTVYRIDTTGGGECVVHSFERNHVHSGSIDGARPVSPVRVWDVDGAHRLYGATVDGGAYDVGTVFEVNSSASCQSGPRSGTRYRAK